MSQGEQVPNPVDDFRAGVNFLYLLALAHSLCITPFIRRNFGIGMPGFAGIAALILLILTICGTEDYAMITYLKIWFVALLCQRLFSFVQYCRGRHEHSQYDGWPWLALWIPFIRTEERAKTVEPSLCLILAVCCVPWSESVAAFVGAGAISLSFLRVMQLTARRRQVIMMRDLRIEQQLLSERLRGVRKDF